MIRGLSTTRRPCRARDGDPPMSSYTTNEFKSGLKLLIDGDPSPIVDNEYVKPGKGQAFNRVRMRNLRTGRTIEKTFSSGESIEAADVMDAEMQYLYTDGDFWTFMNPENYEQLAGRRDRGRRCGAVAQGRHRLHHHAVEWRAAAGDAAAAHRAEGRRDRSRPERRHRHRRQKPPSSRPAPSCGCRCSSTKAKSSASTRAARRISRGKNSVSAEGSDPFSERFSE